MQQSATEMTEDLEHLCYEEKLRELELFRLESLVRILSVFINTWQVSVKMEPGSIQWCIVIGTSGSGMTQDVLSKH